MSGLGRSWRRRPSASYRLQFNRHFGFQQALDLLPYLNELGISDCYASPLFQARPESLHGYDVCDFARLNPDLGAPEDFERFCAQLHQKNMGLLLDIVPNHMGIDLANPWWIDVLENGQASRYAEWFDIDWYPQGLEGKVLLPILEDHYGKVLEAGKLLLKFESGEFRVAYYDRHFPLSARSYPELLNELAIISQKRPNTGCLAGEFQTLLSAFDYEKSRDPDSTAKLQKLKQRLATLIQQSKDLDAELVEVLAAFNGRAGDAHSFDKLHALLQQQHYRLAYWHVAPEQINYRRFFDVSELISLRMELPEVFETTHELVLQWIHEGKVTGLRIDHPDGLWNPKEYLNRIQASVQPSGPPLYIVVEKILTGDESLPLDWPAAGTTGYDFLNQVNGLFVNKENRNSFDSLYREFTQTNIDFETIVNTSKKQVLLTSFLSELDNLTRR